ncbi:hypothetical protein BJX61DRAFT_548473 [Aspergillus egyptiacus]|nr:hypothetical protein BJX61DRAFT_548473 [Aspergillus egyptiacus]
MWPRYLGKLALPFALSCLIGFPPQASAQDCSASNPCATGCCSVYGYCGTGEDYCGENVCVGNCDYTEVTQCNKDKPCELGCCSKFGVCGMGPDYCSTDNCVSSCDQKAECDPGDWGAEYVNSTSCPLNVCCSKYGFCGTTEEFCGSQRVQRPSCDSNRPPQRVVGYYEGWAPNRVCNRFWPEQIPQGVYSHLNYAFASVNPETYEVLPPNSQEAKLMTRLTDLKLLAASEDNQRKFFRSLISFMATYGFDGVDIDWEYPGADDRSGRKEDYANFPRFMANLKKALQGTGGRSEISLTLPTSYWYLQHFDIKGIAKHVDYFNYMSYDLYGTWDGGNKWTGAFLNCHTNLTEITEVMDLLWRNDINPDQVVLGLAFYARGFTMADTSCREAGCMFVSGSEKGLCSQETGVLLNKPTLDQKAAVQVLSWDDQWLKYDDEKTFELKIDFAKRFCLGGVMVWAVSQDTLDGTYSRILEGLAPPVYKPGRFYEVEDEEGQIVLTREERSRQCRWTGCGETCGDGFVAVSREDPGRSPGELMLDGLDCPHGATHTLCSPEEHHVVCGWYSHNNGDCDPTCPHSNPREKWFEIGSVRQGLCHKGYQAACCQVVEPTQLYQQVQWSSHPNCDDGSCPVLDDGKSKVLAVSTTGSGDALCDPRDFYLDGFLAVVRHEERKLCYDPSVDGKTLDNCRYYRTVGLRPDGASELYCSSACPWGMVRLALDNYHYDTCDGGARAFCCDDNYLVERRYPNPAAQYFRDALAGYLDDGMCPLGSGAPEEQDLSAMRDVLVTDWDRYGPGGNLTARDTGKPTPWEYLEYLSGLLGVMLVTNVYTQIQQSHINAWDTWVQLHDWQNLVFDRLYTHVRHLIACEEGEGEEEEPPVCRGDICDEDADPDLCLADRAEESLLVRRSFLSEREQAVLETSPHTFKAWSVPDNSLVEAPRGYYAWKYHRAGEWGIQDVPYQRARAYQNRNDCGNPYIYPQVKNHADFATEHIFEIQNIASFIEWATKGELASGAPANFERIDSQFFYALEDGGSGEFLDEEYLPLTELFRRDPGIGISGRPMFRLMGALGSKRNKKNFYFLEDVVNGMKARIFANINLVSDDNGKGKWDAMIKDMENPGRPLKALKAAIAVWHYLGDVEVRQSYREIVRNIRAVLQAIDERQSEENNEDSTVFVNAWDEWWCDWVRYQRQRTLNWVIDGINRMQDAWAEYSDEAVKLLVLRTLAELEGHAHAVIPIFDVAIFQGCQ